MSDWETVEEALEAPRPFDRRPAKAALERLREAQSEFTSETIVTWLRSAEVADIAFIHGAAFQLMAMDQQVSEAQLYAEFADRAANDPDANVARERFLDGHREVSNQEGSP